MKLLRITAMGLRGLIGKPTRTALSALGIVIGVASVVALTSLGNGVRDSVSGQITDLGPNIITVSPGGGSGGGPVGAETASTLTQRDAGNVADLPSVRAASSEVSTSALAGSKSVQLSGVDPSYDEVRKVELASGRFVRADGEVVLSRADAKRLLGSEPEGAVGKTVALSGPQSVSQNAPQNASQGTSQNAPRGASDQPPAQQLPQGVSPAQARRAQDTQQGAQQSAQRPSQKPPAAAPAEKYEVVGVAASQPQGGLVQTPDVSYVSTSDALGLSGSNTVGQILASATSADKVGQAKADITKAIRSDHGDQKDFQVQTQEDLVSTFTRITDLLNVFLAGIAGISLLVGGIGVMNIMLVSVAERTREIGLRKALGATDSDVLLQFLFEAVLLATLGGLVGVALGIAAPSLLPLVVPALPAPVFGTTQIALAFGVSALIGVLFGVLPAYRSSRLQPVEALRRE